MDYCFVDIEFLVGVMESSRNGLWQWFLSQVFKIAKTKIPKRPCPYSPCGRQNKRTSDSS